MKLKLNIESLKEVLPERFDYHDLAVTLVDLWYFQTVYQAHATAKTLITKAANDKRIYKIKDKYSFDDENKTNEQL